MRVTAFVLAAIMAIGAHSAASPAAAVVGNVGGNPAEYIYATAADVGAGALPAAIDHPRVRRAPGLFGFINLVIKFWNAIPSTTVYAPGSERLSERPPEQVSVKMKCTFDHDEGTYVNVRKFPCGSIVDKVFSADDIVYIPKGSHVDCVKCMIGYDGCWSELSDGNWVANKFLMCWD